MLGQLVDDYLLDFDIFHVSHVTGNPDQHLSTILNIILHVSELLHYIEPKYLSGNSTQSNHNPNIIHHYLLELLKGSESNGRLGDGAIDENRETPVQASNTIRLHSLLATVPDALVLAHLDKKQSERRNIRQKPFHPTATES